MNCNERCSGHCINNKPCHHVSGECSNGCKDGYIGLLCNDGKKYSFLVKKKKGVHIGNCWEVVCSLNEIKQGQRYSIGYIGYNPTEFTKKYRKIM